MTIIRIAQPKPHAPRWDAAPAEYFWLEPGAFYDRFGAAKVPVLASPDATVQACVRDTQVRKYIDLKRPDVAQFVGILATKVPELTQEIQDAVMSMVTTNEERFVKGLIQPILAPVEDPVSGE